MIFLLHVEWPEVPPYKLFLTYYVWRIVWCHFLGIRRGVELHWEVVTFFITFTNVILFLSLFVRFFIFIWTFLHLWWTLFYRVGGGGEVGILSYCEEQRYWCRAGRHHFHAGGLHVIIISFWTPVLNSQGVKKTTLCNTKSTKIKLEWTLLLLLLHKTVMQ